MGGARRRNRWSDARMRRGEGSAFVSGFTRWGTGLLATGLFVVVSQAFIPGDEFVHRSDDAFYYFGVAANFPDEGTWTFDRIHETNGVQPLWALILTAIAQVVSWVGVTDRDVLARVFVGLTACFLFASSMLLFHLLRRTVGVGTAFVAAGAFLFPLGIVWSRTWGMENSLYAFLLLASVAWFQFKFLPRPTMRQAAILGVLVGLTALARLNAVLLIPCLVGWIALGPPARQLAQRWRLGALVGGIAALPPLAYAALNYGATGHALPVSGTVKSIEMAAYLRENGISSRLSPDFVSTVIADFGNWLGWFVESRLMDAFWVLGVRLVSDEAPWPPVAVALLLGIALAPALFGARAWSRLILDRFARLLPFTWVLVFAAANVAVSVVAYPIEIPYAITRWWLAETEIVIVVLASSLVAGAVGFLGERFVPSGRRLAVAVAGAAIVIALSIVQSAAFYWDGEPDSRDWHRSFNEEMREAALWMETNLPEDALVGSWNAGVLGYYAKQRVVNLDGLINSYELVPHLREGTTPEYILSEKIEYLSEAESFIPDYHPEVAEELRLQQIYASDLPLLHTRYVIYRVLGARSPTPP